MTKVSDDPSPFTPELQQKIRRLTQLINEVLNNSDGPHEYDLGFVLMVIHAPAEVRVSCGYTSNISRDLAMLIMKKQVEAYDRLKELEESNAPLKN